MKRNFLFKFCLAGALIGYLVLHPLVMLLSYFMGVGEAVSLQGVMSQVQQSFAPAMLPWSLSFVLFSGLICFYYGKLKQANKEKEALIANLQKALDEVKTLSGMLPICSSCKKIRNDEGYWQQIEEYIRDHSEADFTHGICNDCVKELYPEFHKQFEEKMNDKKNCISKAN
jgi:preprotein translocase subunit YajC